MDVLSVGRTSATAADADAAADDCGAEGGERGGAEIDGASARTQKLALRGRRCWRENVAAIRDNF